MEEVTKELKGYWPHGGYEKLDQSSRRRNRRRRKSAGRVELAAVEEEASSGSGQRRRRFWKLRFRFTPRLKLKLKLRRSSMKKILIKLRNGYVRIMMKLANSRFLGGGGHLTAADAAVGFGFGSGSRRLKEYDEKIVLEIYKTIVMAQGVVPLDADKLSFSSRHLSVSSTAVTN